MEEEEEAFCNFHFQRKINKLKFIDEEEEKEAFYKKKKIFWQETANVRKRFSSSCSKYDESTLTNGFP